jgi:hypothetical protein
VRAAIAVVVAVLVFADPLYRIAEWLVAALDAPGDAFELYAIGGSTMAGVPYNTERYDSTGRPHGFSASTVIAEMLGDAVGGRRIDVRVLAQAGYSAFPQALRLERATRHRRRDNPGVVLLYTGENEGFPPGDPPPPASGLGAWLANEGTRRSPLLRDLWLFLIAGHHVERERSMAAFERSVRWAIELALERGLVPIVAPFVSNAAGIEPNAGDVGVDPSDDRALIEQVRSIEARGDLAEAASQYLAAIGAHPRLEALLTYEAARCVRAAGDIPRAKELFMLAIDRDSRSQFGRATRAQNELLRRLAAEYRIPYVDLDAAFAAASPNGIPGNELFVDGHHPNLRGHLLIADGFARAIGARFEAPVSMTFPDPERQPDAVPGHFKLVARLDSVRLLSAGWLLAISAGHPWPEGRLALAEEHLQAVLAEGKEPFSAWLGLAVIRATRAGHLLANPRDLDAVARWGLFWRGRFCLPESESDGALSLLEQRGASPEALAQLRALRASGGFEYCR